MKTRYKSILLAGVCALGLAACSTNGQVRGSAYYQHGSLGTGIYVDPYYRGYYHPRYRTYHTYPDWRRHPDRRWHHRHRHDQRHENRLRPLRPTPSDPFRPEPGSGSTTPATHAYGALTEAWRTPGVEGRTAASSWETVGAGTRTPAR